MRRTPAFTPLRVLFMPPPSHPSSLPSLPSRFKVTSTTQIASLWSNYGHIYRLKLAGPPNSLILKSISIDYRRPVVYPDTLLVAHRVHPGAAPRSSPDVADARCAEEARLPTTHFGLAGAILSYQQRRIVPECDSVIVWYDYDRLAKCDPGPEAREALLRRLRLGAP